VSTGLVTHSLAPRNFVSPYNRWTRSTDSVMKPPADSSIQSTSAHTPLLILQAVLSDAWLKPRPSWRHSAINTASHDRSTTSVGQALKQNNTAECQHLKNECNYTREQRISWPSLNTASAIQTFSFFLSLFAQNEHTITHTQFY